MGSDERYLTTDEVAEMTRTSVWTVHYWRQTGSGPPGFKLGRRVLYAESEVRAWIERSRQQAGGTRASA